MEGGTYRTLHWEAGRKKSEPWGDTLTFKCSLTHWAGMTWRIQRAPLSRQMHKDAPLCMTSEKGSFTPRAQTGPLSVGCSLGFRDHLCSSQQRPWSGTAWPTVASSPGVGHINMPVNSSAHPTSTWVTLLTTATNSKMAAEWLHDLKCKSHASLACCESQTRVVSHMVGT